MEKKNNEANTELKYFNNNREEGRKLPQRIVIEDIDNFKTELSSKLRNIYQGHYSFSVDYEEKDSGKPLPQTMKEIIDHPFWGSYRSAFLENIIQKSKEDFPELPKIDIAHFDTFGNLINKEQSEPVNSA